MTVRPVAFPPAPFTVPGGAIDDRFAAVAAAINRKADAGIQGPASHFLALIAPDGSTWRLTVDDTGLLHTEQVPRP